MEHVRHVRDAGGVPAGGVEGDELGAAVEHAARARGGRNIEAREVHRHGGRKTPKQVIRSIRSLNALFDFNAFDALRISIYAPGYRRHRPTGQLPHFSAIFRTNRQAALGVNHPFAAAPSLPAIGLGGGIVGFVGFPIGRDSRLYDVGRNAGIRSVIFCSILRRSANTSAIGRSIAIAGNAARLHAVGLRARDATGRTGPSAIGGNIRAIGHSGGAPFFVCCRPLLRHRRRNGA